MFRKSLTIVLAVMLGWALQTRSATAGVVFETELKSMDLKSIDLNPTGVFLPLGPGWGDMLTNVQIRQSQQLPSKGLTLANPSPNSPEWAVDSFFNVFFDLTITDADPDFDFGGQSGVTSLQFLDIGPAQMSSRYSAIFDESAPNFGLFPPPAPTSYGGWSDVKIPLGMDLNGNGENDMIKFTFALFTVMDENPTFIILPDGTVIHAFEVELSLDGAVDDESTDPPFGPFVLTGPTTATSVLRSPAVPEPPTIAMWSILGALGIGWARSRRSPRHA